MMKAVSGLRAGIAAQAFALAMVLGHAAPAAAQVFYNGKLDAQAKTALAEYTQMKKAQVAKLDARLAEIDAEEIALKAAIRARGEAERDKEVILVLEPDRPKDASHAVLAAKSASRFKLVTGTTIEWANDPQHPERRVLLRLTPPARPDPIAMTPILSEAGANRSWFDDLLTGGVDPASTIRDSGRLQPLGGRAAPLGGWTLDAFCELFGSDIANGDMRAVLGSGNGSIPWRKFVSQMSSQSKFRCAGLPQKPPALPSDWSQQLRFLVTGKPDWKGAAPGPLDGLVNILEWQAQVASQDLKSLKETREAANARAKEIRDDLGCLQKHWSDQLPQESLQIVASGILALVNGKDLPESKPISATPGSPDAAIQQCRADAAKQRAEEATAEEDAPKAMSIGQIIQAAEDIGLVGDDLDKLRNGPLFEIVGLLADPDKARKEVAKNCGPAPAGAASGPTSEQKRLCATVAVVDTLNLLDRGRKIGSGFPGAIAALQVRAPAAQLEADLLGIRARALASRAANVEQRRVAILAELGLLYRAWLDAQNAKSVPYLRTGSLKLARSFDEGRLPQDATAAIYPMIKLREWTARERAVLKARHEIADTGVAILVESAGAGLKPVEIATFLSTLGIGKIAIFGGTK